MPDSDNPQSNPSLEGITYDPTRGEGTEAPTERSPEGDREGSQEERSDQARSRGPFGGLTPQEASRKAVQARREKAAAREAQAELDKLTVLSRFSVALARKAPYAELEGVVEALVREAKAGKVQAAKLLLDYVRVLAGSGDDQPDDAVRPEDMTPAQRAAVRARILAELAEQDESPASGEEA